MRGQLFAYFTAAILSGILVTRLAAIATSPSKAKPQQREIIYSSATTNNLSKSRAERIERLRRAKLDGDHLIDFVTAFRDADRAWLIREGYLADAAPQQGTSLLRDEHRTARGNQLLQQAKDMLFGLLFGDGSTHTCFNRVQRELLTLTVPRTKVGALEFMKASTEHTAAGIWQDPEGVSNDERVENVIIEVEYGESPDELIGNGIVVALALINHLEMNEQILYARMIDVEQSTLIQ